MAKAGGNEEQSGGDVPAGEIKGVWVGEPPECCKGNCEIVDGFMCLWCKVCGWDDL